MEDEGFVDDEFIAETARRCIALHGLKGIAVLRERARIAEASGDFLLAQTWREIVALAERMIAGLERG